MPGKFYVEGLKEKVDISSILAALVVYSGKTTHAGASDGSELVCSHLTEAPDFDGHIVVALSGDYAGQSRAISGVTIGGVVPVSPDFSGQIVAGVEFLILSIRGAEIDIEQIDKLAGEDPVTGSTSDDWETAEADIVSIGDPDTRYKLHSLILDINDLVGTVTIRLYTLVNGVERQVYSEAFAVAADGPGLWIVNGTIGIHQVLRVTAQSDNGADNGQAIGYDYMLEAM